jgi:hypothetical protein
MHSKGHENMASAREHARGRLSEAALPGEHLLAAAWLASLGEVEPYRTWPSTLSAEEAATLPGWIASECEKLVLRLRQGIGDELAEALMRAQAFACLLHADREHGALLAAEYDGIAGVLLECARLPLDDAAACELAVHSDVQCLQQEHLIPIVAHPVGLTACASLADAAALDETNGVTPVCRVPVFEQELVFDSGRPSERMMERYAQRRGALHCLDGSKSNVRAILEEDWRVSVQFDAGASWCARIDRVRVGTRVAESVDDKRDFWTASLAQLGLDAQTRLVNQPILVTLATGERFSL